MSTEVLNEKEYELLKLEYAACAERYENLYKSIWTQFNYFIIATGALLAFGKDSFKIESLIVLASFPLLFWYFGTFETLNKYADKASERASEIENIFNHLYLKRNNTNDLKFKMSHWDTHHRRNDRSQSRPKLNNWVAAFAILLMLLNSALLAAAQLQWNRGLTLTAFTFLMIPITLFSARSFFRETMILNVRNVVRLTILSIMITTLGMLFALLLKQFQHMDNSSFDIEYKQIYKDKNSEIVYEVRSNSEPKSK
ncbi:MAG: hypothetical protein ACKVQS_09565 [Fimbriimonadaceae bacterium]